MGLCPNSGCFLMAPWVGHVTHGRLAFRGETAELPLNWGAHAVHGLVARGPWEVDRQTERSVGLSRSLDTLWPWRGVVRQGVRLNPEGVHLEAEIEAADHAMPVSLGWHPWFRRPAVGPIRVRVRAAHRLELDGELIPTGSTVPVAGETDLRTKPILANRRIDEVFVGVNGPAELSVPGLDLRIEFDPAISTVVVYTPAEAVCVEPWSAWPDALRLDGAGLPTGLRVLEPGEVLRHWTYWTWTTVGLTAEPGESEPAAR